ncbi:hypothetical protein RR49_00557 [Microbacterium ginsengisoli]|uniref:GGDEF domain-containing protein n=1 Tax=Microbacterium ginsengisoli TaxID=400772 RepID=A0A0F0LWW1_9MICO|nr:GGDEF domain-containing protein [Microbacterium ginsengisoli]KJL39182.1 hypothetical protein RR49_00557 [Microbacterium ginsengisoli]MBN9209858.1 GGDEF domain-containing protein [Microbacterium ginsengisoli]
MTLDLASVSVMTALVVAVAGILFVSETLLRRDEAVGAFWAIAFLSGIGTSTAYLVWAVGVGGFVPIAIGNALFVSSAGCMWLGARAFNQRAVRGPVLLVALCVAVSAAAVIVRGPAGGDWAGAFAMFVNIAGFAALGAVEMRRRPVGRLRSSVSLAVVLGIQSAYYVARTVVFVASGPDSDLFRVGFGTISTSVLTVTLTIVAVVVTSVLRASRSQLRGYGWVSDSGIAGDGVFLYPTFLRALDDLLERARWEGRLVAVISVRIDDLRRIGDAFGEEVRTSALHLLRDGVRRHAPLASLIGEDDDPGLLFTVLAPDPMAVRRVAVGAHRALFDALGRSGQGVLPVVGVGVALSETIGYDTERLVAGARAAARKAPTMPDSSVMFAGVDDAGGAE